jgi:uncharacterized integral membrane protein
MTCISFFLDSRLVCVLLLLLLLLFLCSAYNQTSFTFFFKIDFFSFTFCLAQKGS